MHSHSSFTALLGAMTLGMFILVAPLTGCDSRNAYVAPPPPEVAVAQPVVADVIDYVVFTGSTQAAESVNLPARVTGALRSTGYKEGDVVKKGTLLFSIEPETYEAKVHQAEAQLAIEQAKLAQAETEYARAYKLYKANAGSDIDLVKWQESRDSAKASVAMAKASLEEAKINLGYTRVYAPFNGRVGLWTVDPGNLVGPGSTPSLGTIIRYDPMFAYFNISERDLARLSQIRRESGALSYKGYPVEMEVGEGTGFNYKGELDYADLGIDPATGTYLLRGVFRNKDAFLLPGMFVRLRFAAETLNNAHLVPMSAIGEDQAGKYVLVVGEKNVVDRVLVKLGPQQGENVVVLSGIKPTDRIVISGLMRARPGRPVTPVERKVAN